MAKLLIASVTGFVVAFSCYADDPWEISVQHAKSGQYDIDIVAMTWQPSYCISQNIDVNNDPMCASQFKVHSVWPYYKALKDVDNIINYHPSFCLQSPGCPSTNVCTIDESTIDFMQNDKDMQQMFPRSEGLWTHEWQKHGTCSGLTQQGYFQQIMNFMPNIEPELKKLKHFIVKNKNVAIDANQVRRLLASNTSLRCVVKNNKNYLLEVNFAFDRTGQPFSPVNTQIGGICEGMIYIPDLSK